MADPLPSNSHAFVIGIEKYDAGDSWNLDGPASDAVRFLEYLARRGVPKANIHAYLSPLPGNAALVDQAKALAADLQRPTQASFDDLIELSLRDLVTDYLIFYWSGHGVIALDDTRRLYTADALTNVKRNLDLNAFLETLRSDSYPKLDRQALIVDSCANYIPNPTSNLSHRTYSAGTGLQGREQFAIYAASPGEFAKNLNAQKSGLLSKELMSILAEDEATGKWPPDWAAISGKLATRFAELRTQGQARQAPASYWFRSPAKVEQFEAERTLSNRDDNAQGAAHAAVKDYLTQEWMGRSEGSSGAGIERALSTGAFAALGEARKLALAGKWQGRETQPTGPDGLTIDFPISLTLGWNADTATGTFRFVWKKEGFDTVDETLPFEGGFVDDRYIVLNYRDALSGKMQFGALMLGLEPDGKTLKGIDVGYGYVTQKLMTAQNVLTKQGS